MEINCGNCKHYEYENTHGHAGVCHELGAIKKKRDDRSCCRQWVDRDSGSALFDVIGIERVEKGGKECTDSREWKG